MLGVYITQVQHLHLNWLYEMGKTKNFDILLNIIKLKRNRLGNIKHEMKQRKFGWSGIRTNDLQLEIL